MNKRYILVADAEPRSAEIFSQALGEQWEVVQALNGNAALKSLQEQGCHVVVANVELPELDGAELLNRIWRKYPKTVRFIAARDDEKQRVLKSARGAHQFLSQPYDPAAIKDAIERALALDVWVGSDRVRETISRIRTLPTIPTLYTEILAALRSPDATTEQIGGIIAKDMAMMTKLLQLLNSACFGLTREITDPAEAVGILGFETVKTMVMTIKLLNQYDKLNAAQFSVDRLWTHSTAVARTARQLALLETGDRALADSAFTAGLLHDIGKVVLASNFEDTYSGSLLLGYKQKLPAWDVERDVYGADHGEIGAYLLGLWGMPMNLLESTALHHTPSRATSKAFTPLTAVHVANVFERESAPDELGMVSPKLDEAYLEGLGLLSRVETWRMALGNPDGVKAPAKTKAPEPAKPEMATKPAELQPVPIRIRQPETETVGLFTKHKWLVVGASVAIAALLGWFVFEAPSNAPESPKTPASAAAPQPAAQKPVVAAAPATPAVAPAKPATNQAIAAAKPVEADKPAAASPESPSLFAPTIVRARTTTNDLAPVPKAPPAPEFKLQGIFFSPHDPCAMVDGKTVRPNDHVEGARVVSITASSVTLEYQNQKKVLTVR